MTIQGAANSTAASPALACPHFPPCPGCPLIPVAYAEQLERKRAGLAAALAGTVAEDRIRPVVPSPELHGYRNLSRLVFARGPTGRVELGLYAAGTHRVVPIPRCPIQPEGMNAIARSTGRLARELRLLVFNERDRRGHLRYLAIRADHARRRYLVGIVAASGEASGGAGSEDPRLRTLAAELRHAHPEIVGVTLRVNDSPGNIIFAGEEAWTLGEARLPDTVGRAEVLVSLTSFLQANHGVAGWICRRLEAWAGERAVAGTVLDLYCGIGAIAFHLAGPDRRVTGVEESAGAVADAVAAAERARLPVRFVAASAERFLAEAAPPVEAAVVNPPRPGCSPAVVDALLALAPRALAYVSCNPAALARDLARLGAAYEVEEVIPVDMLPLTPHIEALALLARRGAGA